MLLLLFFSIDLYFLIPSIIAQIFIPTAELVTPTGIATNEANAEIETQPVIVETKTSKCYYFAILFIVIWRKYISII